MKILIWHKIVLLTLILVLATSWPLARQIIDGCRQVTEKQKLNDLADQTLLRGARVLDQIETLHRDSLQLSGDPAVRALLWQESPERFRRLQERFARLLDQQSLPHPSYPRYLQVQFIKRDPESDAVRDAALLARAASPANVWDLGAIGRELVRHRPVKPLVYRELARTIRKAPDHPDGGEVLAPLAGKERPVYTLPPDLTFLMNRVDTSKGNPVDLIGFSRVHRAVELEQQGVDSRPIFVLQTVVRLARENLEGNEHADGFLIVTLDFRPLAFQLANSGRYLTYLLDEDNNLLVQPNRQPDLGFNRVPAKVDEKGSLFARANAAVEAYRGSLPRSADPHRSAEQAVQHYMETAGIALTREQVPDPPSTLKLQLKNLPVEKLPELNQKLLELSRDTLLALTPTGGEGSQATPDTFEIALRGQDAQQLEAAGDALVRRFGPHLSKLPLLAKNEYAVHCCRLRFSPFHSSQPPRYFKLAMAVSREGLAVEIDQQLSVLWRSFFWAIPLAVAATLLVSWWITRPLKKITGATEYFAQGSYQVSLPVHDRGEVGVLARAFQHMGQEIQQRTQKLAESEWRNRTILEMAAEGIITVNQRGKIEGFNRAAERMFGYTVEEVNNRPLNLLLARPWQSVLPGLGANAAGEMKDSVTLDELTHLPSEMEGKRKDGSRFPIELAGSAIQVGERRLFTCIVRDITERKQAEQAIRRAKEELEEKVNERTAELRQTMKQLEVARDVALAASRAKDAFVVSVSHELRTPLFHVDSFAQLLEYTELDEDQKSDLTKIRRASAHLLDLVNDLLDYQKIIMGKIPLELKEFNLQALIQETVEQSRSRAGEGGNTLRVEGPAVLGTMCSDPKRVRQVLFNLLSNGLKFTDNGTVTLSVAAAERGGVAGVRFEVKDTGIGMNAEQMSRLFQPFQRLHSEVTKPGNGLGLAISRELCQALGGTIDAASTPGQGSTFTVWLPLRAPKLEELRPALADLPAVAPAALLPGPAEGDGGDGPLVLVIDDDPSVCELMRRYLEKDGIRIETATNGRDGLRLARQLRPAAITLDIRMPDPDGWKVLSELKQDAETAGIPVIVVTLLDDRSQGFALGAADFLTKPFDWSRLSALLNRYRARAGSVLIVDDDPASRDALQRLVARQGWVASEAENGREALARLAERRPDLILLDLLMPVMNGFELVEELRHHPDLATIPIVVVTAKDMTSEDCRRLSGMVDAILHKGTFDQEDLLREIQRQLSRCVSTGPKMNGEGTHG